MSNLTRREVTHLLAALPVATLCGPHFAQSGPIGRDLRFARTKFGEIAYTESGTGRAALFVHGTFLNGHFWSPVVERVSDVRRTICIDLMAHGATRIPAQQDVSVAAQAEMLEAVCKNLKLGEVDLVANDSGGAVAQIFAARHPRRIRTLTLTDCDTHDNWPPPVIQQLMQVSAHGQLDEVLRPWLLDVNNARQAFAPAFEHPELISAETFQTYFEPLLRTPESIHNLERWFLAADNHLTTKIQPLLKRLHAPTLIAWGTDDAFFDIKWAYWLRETIPGARKVIEVQGGRLFFPTERPNEFAAALREHWR